MIYEKAVYVHIPKCAGLSMGELCRNENISIDAINTCEDHLNKTYDTNCYVNIDSLSKKDLFSFSFVRNPFDRLVSAYKCPWVSGVEVTCHGKRKYNLEFDNFNSFVNKFVLNENDYSFFRWSHVMPYTDTRMKLFNHDGKLQISFIGRFEKLQEDFNTICDKIGIPQQKLPHKNKTNHKHYTEYYDEETKSIVAEKYAKDIEYFGYEFGE